MSPPSKYGSRSVAENIQADHHPTGCLSCGPDAPAQSTLRATGATTGPMAEGPLTQLLVGLGRRVITFDPPGAYRSSRPARCDLDEMLAIDEAQMLDHQDIRRLLAGEILGQDLGSDLP